MHLSKYERETIILYNEEEKTASVYTCNTALRKKLAGIADERPDECVRQDGSRQGEAETYIVPKRWIKINPSRILTEEQRARAVEQGRRLAESQNSSKTAGKSLSSTT